MVLVCAYDFFLVLTCDLLVLLERHNLAGR
jgi:hypothetical protein